MNYKHIYGPVNSRRLGVSLGVDMVPFKTCQLDCIYCECGATTNLTNERAEYITAASFVNELDDYLSNNAAPDYVTFGGSGEPTLNVALGEVVAHLKKNYPAQKLALLTNSTLFIDDDVRKVAKLCDLVLPSLDAATDEVFVKINKPAPSVKCSDVINGLLKFSKEYKGTIWLEIFIAPNVNDSVEEILLIKEIVTKINPTRIQLNSLDRTGTDVTLVKASQENLLRISDLMKPLITEIVCRV